ncbi:MAG TPA: tetratricopeptide repeat protein [Anaerolineales bacterium]|nr:tetratricopeptide repeat protein [Anaerolineales bacterium]
MEHSFGNWVKRRRKALDLTQQELARRVGCSASLIFKIESDERRPSRQVAGLLADHLQIPPEQRSLFFKVARQEKSIEHLDSIALAAAQGFAADAILAPQSSPAPVSEPFESYLPGPLTALIGREHEVGMVLQQLQNPACRLLTLTGPGGVGKTRLALEVAHTLCDVFEHGVYFVSLAGTASAEFILPAIADALRFTFSHVGDPKTQLLHYLRGKRILLVLDNLEHLLNDVRLISELLQFCPELKILATSREQLNLRAEWAFAVQGLPLPGRLRLETLEANSAAALFLQRARQARLDFAPAVEDLPYIERICQLVEGLPLGLELAAAWVRTLSCREIAQEIESNIDFLASPARDVPQRHRSMRAVFEYSWQLLSAEEQQVMMGLSVFRGGFTRETAAQVASAALPVLSSLVDKSLVRHGTDKRYDLHEMVRQYAYDQLVKSGRLKEIRDRHFDFFLRLAEDSRSKLRGPDQLTWLSLVESDYDNLRAALEWSLRFEGSRGEVSAEQEQAVQNALKLTGALYILWWMRNYTSEGRKWLQRALDLPARQLVTWDRFRSANAAVILAVAQSDNHMALQLANRNFELANQLNDMSLLAFAHHARGVVFWKLKEYESANDQCQRALELFRILDNRPAAAGVLQSLGRIAMNQHSLALAKTYLDESAQLLGEFGDTFEYNEILCDLGLLAYLQKDFAGARAYHERTLALFRKVGNVTGIEMALNRLADVARAQGHYEEAGLLYTEAFAIYRETGDKDEIASLLHNLGYIATNRGDLGEALSNFREALELQCDLYNEAGIAECLAGVAAVLTSGGQMEDAARLFGAAESIRERVGAVVWPANEMEMERCLHRLRAALPEAQLRAAWAQGRGMSLQQAIAAAQSVSIAA